MTIEASTWSPSPTCCPDQLGLSQSQLLGQREQAAGRLLRSPTACDKALRFHHRISLSSNDCRCTDGKSCGGARAKLNAYVGYGFSWRLHRCLASAHRCSHLPVNIDRLTGLWWQRVVEKSKIAALPRRFMIRGIARGE